MEVASAVVGLILAGIKVFQVLRNFVSNFADVPDYWREIMGEVRDIHYALQRLQSYVKRPRNMTRLGSAATDVGHLSVALGSCMATFSHLERTINRLVPSTGSNMTFYQKTRMGLAQNTLLETLRRLQQHKATMIMLLTIWISESSVETETILDSMNDKLQDLITPTQNTSSPIAIPPSSASGSGRQFGSAGDQDLGVQHTPSLRPPDSDRMSVLTTASAVSLSSILKKTIPYRDRRAFSYVGGSLFSLERGATHWSTFSGGSSASVFSLPYTNFQFPNTSLAEEENIAGMLLPVDSNLLYNRANYYSSVIPSTDLNCKSAIALDYRWREIRRRDPTPASSLPALSENNEPLLSDLMVLIEEVIWYRETLVSPGISSTLVDMYCGLIETLSTLTTTIGRFLYTEMKKSFIDVFFSTLDTVSLDVMSLGFKSTFNLEELSRDSPLTRGTLNEGLYPLGHAAEMSASSAIRVLVDRGVTLDQKTVCTVLKSAKANELLGNLYSTYITDTHPTGDGVPLIELIAEHGGPDTLQLFIKDIETQLNKITHRGETLLHCAARGRNLEMMNFLLGKGARTDLVDAEGKTALDLYQPPVIEKKLDSIE